MKLINFPSPFKVFFLFPCKCLHLLVSSKNKYKFYKSRNTHQIFFCSMFVFKVFPLFLPVFIFVNFPKENAFFFCWLFCFTIFFFHFVVCLKLMFRKFIYILSRMLFTILHYIGDLFGKVEQLTNNAVEIISREAVCLL